MGLSTIKKQFAAGDRIIFGKDGLSPQVGEFCWYFKKLAVVQLDGKNRAVLVQPNELTACECKPNK